MLEIRRDKITSLSQSKSAYDTLYEGHRLKQRDSYYLWILSLLGIEPGKSLLDVCCGEGTLVKFAIQAGLKAYGLDVADVAASRAKEETQSDNILIADGETLPFEDECFDYVTSLGSLEHYLNPDRGVKEISRVLKKDGTACILVPNSFGLLGNVKHVWRTGEIFDDGQPIERYATRKVWHSLLEENGLVPRQVVKYEREFPRTLEDFFWFLSHPLKILRLIVAPFIPLNLANCFVFLCSPANAHENS